MNTWQLSAPHEYGFYSNVNPERDHPRWSQARERRIGEFFMRPDADVQRIRRPGGIAVHRNGSEEKLLKHAVRPPHPLGSTSPSCLRRRWFLSPTWSGARSTAISPPIHSSRVTNETGIWTLRLVVITLALTPVRRVTGWHALTRFRRMIGLFAFFYGSLHFLTYLVGDRFASLDFPDGFVAWSTLRNLLVFDLGRHREASVHHRRIHRVRLDDPARADIDHGMDSTAGRP